MKRLATLTWAAALSLAAMADDFNLYLTGPGSESVVMIEQASRLSSIVFNKDGDIVVNKTDGTSQTLAAERVKEIYFATEQTVGVSRPAVAERKDKPVLVRDIVGRTVTLDLRSRQLPTGLYIIDNQKVYIR